MTQGGSSPRKRALCEETVDEDGKKEAELVLSTMHAITEEVEKVASGEPSEDQFGNHGDCFYPFMNQKWLAKDIGQTVDFNTDVSVHLT